MPDIYLKYNNNIYMFAYSTHASTTGKHSKEPGGSQQPSCVNENMQQHVRTYDNRKERQHEPREEEEEVKEEMARQTGGQSERI